MSFLDFLIGGEPVRINRRHYSNYQPEDIFSLFRREEKNKTINLLVGDTVVKIQLIAVKDDYNEIGTISCKVLEINGDPVSQEEQDEKMKKLNLEEAPTLQQQKKLLLDTLEKFGLFGNPLVVSDDYVRGHLRVRRINARLGGGQ